MGKRAGRVQASEKSNFSPILRHRVSWGRYKIARCDSFHNVSVNMRDFVSGCCLLIINFALQPVEEPDARSQASVFQFETEDLELLPIRDLALFGHSDLAEDFGFSIGPVCFS